MVIRFRRLCYDLPFPYQRLDVDVWKLITETHLQERRCIYWNALEPISTSISGLENKEDASLYIYIYIFDLCKWDITIPCASCSYQNLFGLSARAETSRFLIRRRCTEKFKTVRNSLSILKSTLIVLRRLFRTMRQSAEE